MHRETMLMDMANVCETWTREELIQFVYDRLYDELDDEGDAELESMYEQFLERKRDAGGKVVSGSKGVDFTEMDEGQVRE